MVHLAETTLDDDKEGARSLVAQAHADAKEAVENLRDLARRIYPPFLVEHGLVAALEARVRRAAVPVTVQADAIGRYSNEAEAAVYFCALEAVANVAKYARASQATVRLTGHDGALEFSVTDNGIGFDLQSAASGSGLQGMADRMAAFGGELQVSSGPARGTTVTGRLPVRPLERVL